MSDDDSAQQPAGAAGEAGEGTAGKDAGAAGGNDKAAEGKAAKGKKDKAAKDKAAKDKGGKGKGGKDKNKKDGKGKHKKDKAPAGSLASHPRAAVQIRRAKGWGGLAGFLIAAYLSLKASVPPDLIGLRAVAAGAAGYMLGWACSVAIWRQLVIAEMRAITERSNSGSSRRTDSDGGEKPA